MKWQVCILLLCENRNPCVVLFFANRIKLNNWSNSKTAILSTSRSKSRIIKKKAGQQKGISLSLIWAATANKRRCTRISRTLGFPNSPHQVLLIPINLQSSRQYLSTISSDCLCVWYIICSIIAGPLIFLFGRLRFPTLLEIRERGQKYRICAKSSEVTCPIIWKRKEKIGEGVIMTEWRPNSGQKEKSKVIKIKRKQLEGHQPRRRDARERGPLIESKPQQGRGAIWGGESVSITF